MLAIRLLNRDKFLPKGNKKEDKAKLAGICPVPKTGSPLASGITGSLYLFLCVLSTEIPGAHAAAKSSLPWLHEHPITPVVLVSLAVTLLLLRTHTRRLAGLSFGAGALLVLSGLGTHWFFTAHQEDVKLEAFYQLRQADIAYRDTGAQRAARDSFERQAARCYHKDLLGKEPAFPGGDRALDAQVQVPDTYATRRAAPPSRYLRAGSMHYRTNRPGNLPARYRRLGPRLRRRSRANRAASAALRARHSPRNS